VTTVLFAASPSHSLTLEEFKGLLFTEVHDEVDTVLSSRRIRRAKESANVNDLNTDVPEDDFQNLWSHIIDHGWSTIGSQALLHAKVHDRRRSLRGSSGADAAPLHPLLICNKSPQHKSGNQKRRMMEDEFGNILHSDKIVVYNDYERTCFHVSADAKEATKLRNITSTASDYDVVPMADIMKITVNTFTEITHDSWSLSSSSSDPKEEQWERMIRVAFTSGSCQALTDSEVMNVARDIISYTQSLGRVGAKNRRLIANSKADVSKAQPSTQRSLTEAFSLTSVIPGTKDDKTRRLADVLSQGRAELFISSVENGLEADHGCQSMFDQMEIRSQGDRKGFDIILNPMFGQHGGELAAHHSGATNSDSSAMNLDCVVSLVMALSTHSSVLNVEVDSHPTLDDYDARWITQTKVHGWTPLSDAGLTGRGQVVSVIDTGVQPDNRFFGPTSASIINNWDMQQRKIVSYYTLYGNDQDIEEGHGTAVAGIIVGKAITGNTDANGIAEDAKLHVVDASKGGDVINPPSSPRDIFAAMYNNGAGAKIANGSFSTNYSVYKTSCKMYDDELFGTYQEIAYVASAGNKGANGSVSRMETIGNPAACKNTIAVGASQSSDNMISHGDMGMDYLAMFSSRGPTADGRMKPDIVAPGYTVQTARATGNDQEDVYSVFGTSYSAPVVAGNAALVRQYFEEGWFPCGSPGCGAPIRPSGSLVKAVLMNGGQSLKRVQKVNTHSPEAKVIGEDLKPYDNSQGMGLVNLAATLPMNDDTKFHGFVQNNHEIRDGEEHTFLIRAITAFNKCPNPELSVTLAWYDVGATFGCTKCLLNDLDVTVQATTWSGNADGPLYRANNKIEVDDRNNVERVRIFMEKKQRYLIKVKATNLSSDSIRYSLISTGCFRVLNVKA